MAGVDITVSRGYSGNQLDPIKGSNKREGVNDTKLTYPEGHPDAGNPILDRNGKEVYVTAENARQIQEGIMNGASVKCVPVTSFLDSWKSLFSGIFGKGG